MITVIQALVIIVALAIVMSVLVGRQTYTARAWKKVALCLLALAMVVAVLFPGLTNMAAKFVGVGRGADLLLYCLTLAFIAYVINTYIHQQRERDILHRLARRIALLEASMNKEKNIK